MVHDDALLPEQILWSPNGQYHLKYQADGNLVLYDSTGHDYWNIERWGTPERALLKWDGDFAAFHAVNIQVWATGAGGHHGAYLALQDDGNLVVYDLYGNAIWAHWW